MFRSDGKPTWSYRTTWKHGVERAAHVERDGLRVLVRPQLVDRIDHDLRRSAVRNLERTGVSHVVMKLCGWKTDAMFRRYSIVDERDLRDAVALLAKGTTGGQSITTAAEGGR